MKRLTEATSETILSSILVSKRKLQRGGGEEKEKEIGSQQDLPAFNLGHFDGIILQFKLTSENRSEMQSVSGVEEVEEDGDGGESVLATRPVCPSRSRQYAGDDSASSALAEKAR